MRTVIIGLGTVSRTHRKALALMDDVELVAVADVKPEKKEELPEGVHFYEDYITSPCAVNGVSNDRGIHTPAMTRDFTSATDWTNLTPL